MTARPTERKVGPLSRLAIRLIETYRANVSGELEVKCRFVPTCSAYSLEAYQRYGFVRATAKTATRLTRCRPSYRGSVLDLP